VILLWSNVRGDDPKPGKKGEPSYDSKTMGQWLAELKDRSPAVRREAASALGSLDPPTKEVVPVLLAALGDADPSVRSNAAGSLVHVDRTHIEQALPSLLAGLKHQDADVRRSAASALGDAGSKAERAAPGLIVALKDSDRSVSKEAAIALAWIGPAQSRDAVPRLMKALKDGQDQVGGPSRATTALWKIGRAAPETIPILIAGLKDPKLRVDSAYILGLIGPPARSAIPALVEASAHRDTKLRCSAAMALVEIEPTQAQAAVRVLMKEVDNPDRDVRSYAVRGLGEIGPRAAEAAPVLIAALAAAQKRQGGSEPLEIGESLGQMGSGAKQFVPRLIAMLKADAPLDRLVPIMALGQMGPVAKDAVPLLKASIEKKDEVAWLSARSLAQIDPANAESAIPVLMEMMGENLDFLLADGDLLEAIGPSAKAAAPALLTAMIQSEPVLRIRLMKILCRIDPAGAAAKIPSLLRELKSEDPKIRRFAIQAFGMIGPAAKEAVPGLIALLKDADFWLDAAIALGSIGGADKEVVAAFSSLLQGPDTAKRRQTGSKSKTGKLDLLDSLKDPGQFERLMTSRWLEQSLGQISRNFPEEMFDLRSDPNAVLCRYAVTALGQLGARGRTAAPILLKARQDPDADVRLSAACALVRIDPEQAKDVIPDLTTGLKAPEWWVRAGAARALGTIGPNAKTAFPALAACLNDPIKPVRKESAAALKQLDAEGAQRLFAR
jgi:HEAT repeat protein